MSCHIKILKVIFWMNGDGTYLPLRTAGKEYVDRK